MNASRIRHPVRLMIYLAGIVCISLGIACADFSSGCVPLRGSTRGKSAKRLIFLSI